MRKQRLMPKIITAFILIMQCCACAVPSTSANSNGNSSQNKDINSELHMVLNKLDETNEKMVDLKAKVTYTRKIPLLDERESSEGKLLFKKPDLIHLKLGVPRHEEIYSDGRYWWIINHKGQQVEKYRSSQTDDPTPITTFLNLGYGGSSEKLREEYEIELIEGKTPSSENSTDGTKLWRLKLTPRSDEAPRRFSTIVFQIPEGLWTPNLIELHESEGEILHIYKFHDMRRNTDIKEKTFKYSPPNGYTVIQT